MQTSSAYSDRRMSVRWSVAAVLLAAIITIALVFAFVQPSTAVERIADGVSAGGVDVSGLTLAEAATKLRGTQATRVARDSVTVRAADLTWRLEASSASVRCWSHGPPGAPCWPDAARPAGRSTSRSRSRTPRTRSTTSPSASTGACAASRATRGSGSV